jgi:hypothetical protein
MKKRTKTKYSPKKRIGGPFLTMALICERVLNEKDEVKTIVRVFDRLIISTLPPGAPPEAKIVAQFTLVAAFKSGDYTGTKNVQVSVSGDATYVGAVNAPSVPLVFAGGEQGPTLILDIAIAVNKPGLLWFDVLLDADRVSRIPLRIELQHGQQPPAAQMEQPKKTIRRASTKRQ